MAQDPLISLILPVFQGEATLEAALESIRRQHLTDWECWVVDDGSTDRSSEIVRQFARIDSRFRLLERRHAGIVASLNAGIAQARGRWVARMDCDDLMLRSRLSAQLDALNANPSWVGAGCHVRMSPRSSLTPGARAYESWLNSHRDAESIQADAFVECPLAHPTWILRRDILQAHPYRDQDWPEDYDLLLRILLAGHALGVVPSRLLLWRDDPNRLQRVDERYSEHAFVRCKAHFLCAGPLRDHVEYILWGHGGTGRRIKRALATHNRSVSTIVELHPGRLGNRIDGAPVIPPERLLEHPTHPILVSVAGAQARSQIRMALMAMGKVEGQDFFCVA